MKPRAPRDGSLRAKLLGFFDANKDEELDYSAISTKFSVSRGVAKGIVRQMCGRGELQTAHVIRLPERKKAP